MNNAASVSNPFKHLWTFDKDLYFLNHGSFGACPTAVIEKQREFYLRMEEDPMVYYDKEQEPGLGLAREAIGNFLNAPADDVVFVPNTTTGVNTILRSLSYSPGEELLITNNSYNACKNAVEYVAERYGLKTVIVDIPRDVQSPEAIISAILDGCTERTRLALIDHVTAPTALFLPIEEIVAELTKRNIETLIDGAHSIGMVPVDIERMKPTYFTGNCHKWLCAPKGAAVLYVNPEKQQQIRPLTISHGANSPRTDKSRFQIEFGWTGTRDVSPWLTVPFTIDYMAGLVEGGWDEIRTRNKQQLLRGGRILAEALEIEFPTPEVLLGSIATFPLPRVPHHSNGTPWTPLEIWDTLNEKYHTQVICQDFPKPGDTTIRISAMLYNSDDDYHHLAEAMKEILSQ